jgi:hypothetical protein
MLLSLQVDSLTAAASAAAWFSVGISIRAMATLTNGQVL